MPKLNWRAKAVYLAIALALAIGTLTGLAAATATTPVAAAQGGSSRLKCWIEVDRCSAPTNGLIVFSGGSNLDSNLNKWKWHTDGADIQSGPSNGTGNVGSITLYWGSSGEKSVWLEVKEGDLTANAYKEVMIGGFLLEPAIAHNVLGTLETFSLPGGVQGKVTGWVVEPQPQITVSVVPGTGDPGDKSITVHCTALDTDYEGGAAYIYAYVDTNEDGNFDQIYQAEKKWGKIDDTILMPYVYDQSGDSVPATTTSSMIVWNENMKRWEGGFWMNEVVLGSYSVNITPEIPSGVIDLPADGAIVHWYLLDGSADVSTIPASGSFDAINSAINALPDAKHVTFGGSGTNTTTISGDALSEGITGVSVDAVGEESVYIIAVATYPDQLLNDAQQYPVFPEIATWNFWTQQIEKVPQVRWVEEKIVLEKNWGTNYDGYLVHYAISSGNGTLESVDLNNTSAYQGLNLVNNADSVWTEVGGNGVSRCILTSPDAGEVHVTAGLYQDGDRLINQHEFVVYFMKLYSVTLGNPASDPNGVTRIDNPLTLDVVEGHNSGLWWDPENVWDTSKDVTQETLNVSQDALLRARVKGYFYGNQMSTRPEKWIDLDPTAETGGYDPQTDSYVTDLDPTNDQDLYLAAGYWVLPDDWARLAGPKWQQLRPHWDIMDQPSDNIMSDADGGAMDKLGSYVYWGKDAITGADVIEFQVADWPVIGPYSSLDSYTPDTNNPLWRKTIVPNGELNWWDCPMPPIKVSFQISSSIINTGYFKEVDKGDVYYKLVNTDTGNDPVGDVTYDGIAYTNPYYAEMVPASWLIPPFVNNMGYDWDSWDWTDGYGPYPFWDMINQTPGVTDSDPQHPTSVWVYADNHGEAMVWLNGDWNLDTVGANAQDPLWKHWTDAATGGNFTQQAGFQPGVPPVVGESTVVAIADYPYGRIDQAQVSNDVTKDWTWGEQKLIVAFEQPKLPDDPALPDHPRKLIVVWVSDRDGMPAVLPVSFQLTGPGAVITGFLDGRNDVGPLYPTVGVTKSREPTAEEIAAYWDPLHAVVTPCNAYIAGAYIWGTSGSAEVATTVTFPEGNDGKAVQVSFITADMVDPALNAGLNSGVYEGPEQSVVAATYTIKSSLVAIWWQDSATGAWNAYQPDAPAWANDLPNLEPGQTYWINVNQDCMWNWSLS